MRSETGSFPRWMAAVLGIALLAVAGGSVWVYREETRESRQNAAEQLTSIATLKADQISGWRQERLRDARELTESPFLGAGVAQYLAAPQGKVAETLLARFRSIQRQHDYADVLLLDPQGQALLDLNGTTQVDAELRAALADALRTGAPAMADVHVSATHAKPYLCLVAPILAQDGQAAPRAIGAIALVNDAAQFLYPLIKSWPTASRTAETLLVRRDGDHVLYLNELRHQANTALRLRVPLSRSDVPAVMAVLGRTGVVEGTDYRGVEVVSALRAIPDSPWFMVAKVDAAEVYSEWRIRETLIFILGVGLMALIIAIGLVAWQRHAKAEFRALYEAEAARRAAVERHSTTLKAIGDAVIAADARGRIDLLNPVAEALTGWSSDEAHGKPLTDVFRIVNEETRAPVEDPVTRVLREGTIVALANHTLLIAKDGTEHPIADSGAPVHDDQHQVVGVVLVFRDQTEARAKEQALRESEARVRRTLESLLSPTEDFGALELADIIDADAIQKLMDDFYALTRVPVAIIDLQGKVLVATGWQDVCTKFHRVHPDTLHNCIECDTELTKEVAPGTFKTYLCKNHLWDCVTPLMLGGRHVGNLFTGQFFFKGEKPDDSVFRAQAAKYGFDEDAYMAAVARVPTWDRATIEVAFAFYARLANLISTLSHHNLTLARMLEQRTRAEAEQLKLQSQLVQAQKMESVGRLAGGVAHDFNNMLGAILGYAELALGRLDASDPIHADLLEIQKAAQRSADLTKQLLAFARRQTIEPRVIDLNDTVEGVLKMLRRLIGEEIDLLWHPAPGVWPVRMDPNQVSQILANLCVNARDAIGGIGRITLETGHTSFDAAYCADHPGFVPGEFVQLTVSDDGAGMEKEVLDHVFEPFFTTKAQGEGTGLGLATVYGIVKQNDAFINIYSEPGHGTTLKIYLPRHLGAVDAIEPAGPVAPVDAGHKTVLLVEDEPSLLRVTTLGLTRLGYRVLPAPSPADAIRLVETHEGRIDLLLTDVVMPEMNGRDLAKRLTALRPGLACIFMSGYTANVIAHRGVLDEGVHFIQKPFSMSALAQKIREALI